MRIKVADLVARYQAIYEERMQDLPIVNPRLEVEAVGRWLEARRSKRPSGRLQRVG